MKPAKAKPKAKRGVEHLDGIPVYCRYDEAVDIDKITGHPRNPNKHGDEQIALLAKIIKTSGWRNPICVSNRSGFVIKGHGRLMAARVLGVSHVPVEYQDYATEAEEYNDLIADNRIAELAERDMSIIKDLLEELDTGANDMDLTGYDHAAIEASLPYCDAYKVGRWNHDARANAIDWAAFGKAAVDMIRSAGKRLYVKHDLRPHFPAGYLTAQEADMNSLSLPDRPGEVFLI